MKLQNPFSNEVRNLYLGVWYCFGVSEEGVPCNSNGVGRGGLELHHIMGRVSGVAFNSCLLCGECHRHIGHSIDEERRLFVQTLKFLNSINYQPTQEDLEFLAKHSKLLTGKYLEIWLTS